MYYNLNLSLRDDNINSNYLPNVLVPHGNIIDILLLDILLLVSALTHFTKKTLSMNTSRKSKRFK